MENQSGQSVLSLCVTEEQRLAIQAFFNHNDWDFNEVSTSSTNQREENMCNDQENTENDQETVHNEQSGSDPEMEPNDEDVCEECFCSPCVTTNRQNWLGTGQRAHARNSAVRKQKYKLFWRMMQDRGAWSHSRYLIRKADF